MRKRDVCHWATTGSIVDWRMTARLNNSTLTLTSMLKRSCPHVMELVQAANRNATGHFLTTFRAERHTKPWWLQRVFSVLRSHIICLVVLALVPAPAALGKAESGTGSSTNLMYGTTGTLCFEAFTPSLFPASIPGGCSITMLFLHYSSDSERAWNQLDAPGELRNVSHFCRD